MPATVVACVAVHLVLPPAAPASPAQAPPSVLAAADAAMQAGRYAEAAAAYERWLAEHPQAHEVLLALGACYIQLGRSAEAAAVLERYVRHAPQSARGHALLGIARLDAVDTTKARAALETALRIDPAQAEAAEALARLHLVEGEPQRALDRLRTLERPDVHLLAEALVRAGDAAGASARLEPRLSEERPLVQTFVLAAWARLKAGDLERAAEIAERGMRLYPDSEIESVYLTLPAPVLAARTAARLERLQSAPDAAEMVALGRVLIDADPARKTRALEIAERLLADAVALAPANPSAHYNYGRALSARDPKAAMAAWEKALALDPPDELRLQILTQLAKTRDALGDPDGAERAFETALAINRRLPRRVPEAALEYVRFLQIRGREREAEAIVGEVIGWNPWLPEARAERARLLAARGDWTAVVAEGEFVLRHAEGNEALLRTAHHLLARAYYRLNQPEKAEIHRRWLESR
ncbi:MAG TPA: tetratricopeptide repeat protein [Vicinamibacterales bacterium]|nr:tetratricopeptide repeat protein [Vicinamibacterales bacterium]